MRARRCIDTRRVSVSADIGTYAHDQGGDTHPGHVAYPYRSGQSTTHSLACASTVAEQVPVPFPKPIVLSCTPETSRARLRPADKALAFPHQASAIEPEYRQGQEFASALVEKASWMARDDGQRFLPLSGGRDNAGRTTNVSLRVPDKFSGSVQEIQFVMQNGAVRKRQEQSIALAHDSFDDKRVWGLERPNAGTSSGAVEYESRAMSAGSAEGAGEHQSEQSEQPRQRSLVDQYWMRTSSQGTARSSSSSSASSIFYEYSGSENTSPLGSPPSSARRDSVGSSVKVCPRARRMLARMLTRLTARRRRRRPS